MAKDEQTKEIVKKQPEVHKPGVRSIKNSWIYALLGVLVIVVVFSAGVAAANHHNDYYRTGGFLGGAYGTKIIGGGPGPGGMMVERHIMFNGDTVSGAQGKTHGVVIKVNGSSFTLAGNGSTTNVTTDSSTQYHGGNTVKVNDSVIAFGTTTNGTLKATTIVINP